MLNINQLRHLANLAKIELSDDELAKLEKDLNEILEYVEQVKNLDLEDMEPMTTGVLQKILLREDIVKDKSDEEIETIKQIIAAFPVQENGYLKVPKILEK